MISHEKITEVRRLLSETTLSQRKIALLTGVSRGSIGAIALGRRPDYEAIQSQETESWEEPTGPLERCGGCGGMVYMPCLLCAALKRSAKKPRGRRRDDDAETPAAMDLDLRPEHRARYEEVRAWRRENEAAESDRRVLATTSHECADHRLGVSA